MKKDTNTKWLITVFILAFVLSIIFSGISTIMANSFPTAILAIIIVVVIGVGIVFDMIGVAVLTSKEANLHAKASKKMKGAKQAIILLKNSTKVASVCNDVIGDICGIVSGALGAVLTVAIASLFDFEAAATITTVIVTAVISACTVGFKAVFKEVATKNSDSIVFTVGKIISIFKKDN